MERAVHHFKVETERKYFEFMKKWYMDLKIEKQIQIEHEQKLQAFLKNMQQKAEEQRRQEEMAEEIERKRQQERILEGREDFAICPKMEKEPININIVEENEENGLPQMNQDISIPLETNDEISEDNNEDEEQKEELIPKSETSGHDNETPEKLSIITETHEEPSTLNKNEESKNSGSPSKRLRITPQKEVESSQTKSQISNANSIKIATKTNIVPKKNNPIMDRMEARKQERDLKRKEILRKKQEQKEAQLQAKKEEEKQKVNFQYY